MSSQEAEPAVKKHEKLFRVKSNSNGSIRLYGPKFEFVQFGSDLDQNLNMKQKSSAPEISSSNPSSNLNLNSTKALSRTTSVSCGISHSHQRKCYSSSNSKERLFSTSFSVVTGSDNRIFNKMPSETEQQFVHWSMERQILKAKAEAKTVSVIDGNLYIDYKFIGPLPLGVRV